MDLIKININFEPHDPKVNRIYLMNTMINAPEVKKMSAIVLNAIAVLKTLRIIKIVIWLIAMI